MDPNVFTSMYDNVLHYCTSRSQCVWINFTMKTKKKKIYRICFLFLKSIDSLSILFLLQKTSTHEKKNKNKTRALCVAA